MSLKAVHDTALWLRQSGIQNRKSSSRLKGGVAAWYEISPRRYPFLYSEITGYMITAAMFMYRIHPDKAWMKVAQDGANWLVRNAFHSLGGVRTRYYLVKNYKTPNYSFHAGRIYAFDTAMAAFGLIQLYKKNPKVVYWKWMAKAYEFLRDSLRLKNGMSFAYWDSKSRRWGEDSGKWSDQSGSFHAKLALFLIDYYRMTGHPDHRKEAHRLLDKTLRLQEEDGRFVTSRLDNSTHLHPHLYTLEGLLYGYLYLGDKSYLVAAQKGLRWARRAVSESGSVSAIYEPVRLGSEGSGFAYHERSDILAQMLRVGSILEGIKPGRAAIDAITLGRIREHLMMFHYAEDGNQSGGFLYGADTDGRLRIHLNAWSSMFAMQALWMFDEFVLKRHRVSMESFI